MLKIFSGGSPALTLPPCRIDLRTHQFFDVDDSRRDSETRTRFIRYILRVLNKTNQ